MVSTFKGKSDKAMLTSWPKDTIVITYSNIMYFNITVLYCINPYHKFLLYEIFIYVQKLGIESDAI